MSLHFGEKSSDATLKLSLAMDLIFNDFRPQLLMTLKDNVLL